MDGSVGPGRPPPWVLRPASRAVCALQRQTRRPARPPAVPRLCAQPSRLALPTPQSDGRPRPRSPAAARAAEGRRPGLGLAPRAAPGPASRAGPRTRRPPRAPGSDSPPPHGLQRPRVTLPTHSPGAQVPRGLERALALGSMAFWSYPVR